MNLHRKKRVVVGRLLGVTCMLALLAGCGAAKSSWEVVSPKRKVPPYEEVQAPAQIPEVPAVMAPVPVVAETPKPSLFSLREIMPDRKFVDGRKEVYGTRAGQWRDLADSFAMYDYPMPEKERWRECYELLTGIVDGYGKLNAMLDQEGVMPEQKNAAPFVVFQQDITFYEKNCQAVFSVAAAALPGQLDKYRDVVSRQGEDVLHYRAEQGDSAGVISSYENLRTTNPGISTSIDARRMYGQALKDEGRLAEAAPVLLDVAGSMTDMEGWPLRMQAAEIFFALGDFEKARKEYQRVDRLFSSMKEVGSNVADRLSLLDGQGEHDMELDLFRQSLLGRLTWDGKNLPTELVDGVRLLEQDFPESSYAGMARALLDELSGKAVSDEGESVTPANETGSGIRPPDAEGTVIMETLRKEALDDKWNDGVAMLDQLQFDQAIVLFGELAKEEEYRFKAQEKLVEASNLAAAELRKEAAALFVKSRNLQNPEEKGKLLLESRRLLLQVMEKYPQTEIVDKVKQNLLAIEEQLRGLNPALLDP
ncbi:MAG: hypothetical protein V1706_08605 [Pseudomonadota bacterium]